MRDPSRRTLALGGALLLACAVVWQTGLGRRWTQRIPPGWSVAYDYVGTETFPAPGDRELPADDVPARYERRQQVSDNRGRPQQVVVEDRYTMRAMTSDTILFEYVTHETVDPGQEIRCADNGFRYRTWIEPATGAVVKVEEGVQPGNTCSTSSRGHG